MANYLPVFLEPAVRIWLTSLPEESVTSWGDLNRKLIESFQATCNRPGNHFDLTRIKQKGDEPLRDYIKRFCAKKTEIPNVPDQQIIIAFLGGIRNKRSCDGIVFLGCHSKNRFLGSTTSLPPQPCAHGTTSFPPGLHRSLSHVAKKFIKYFPCDIVH
ncbi:hypothetical protein PR202_gb07765 [Eleusine coracana subsp. coracana]|uniref:Retrotransposon gag domain-containing protein n=1 Tax=Eleusine coracana subsp. coracana TaxID=191504 RepID=A0AAV5EDD9_ELECO|nr:hypothetical protein PR202_gb07765 [Eleusine coracana subsp. coracana]